MVGSSAHEERDEKEVVGQGNPHLLKITFVLSSRGEKLRIVAQSTVSVMIMLGGASFVSRPCSKQK